MVKNWKLVFIIAGLFICIFIPNNLVYADSFAVGLRASKTDNLKPGDVFEVYYTLEASFFSVYGDSVQLSYDSNVIEPVVESQENYSWNFQYARTGWKILEESLDNSSGFIKGTVGCESTECGITQEMVSDNCLDELYEKIITYKFKVKNVQSQKTVIKVSSNHGNASLDLDIYKKNSNTNLSNLTNNKGELVPAFNKNITDYKIMVDYNTTSIEFAASCEGENCKISDLTEYQLEVGENKIDIVVTAEDGNKKTYQVTVIRENASNNATLSQLTLKDSNDKNININFDSNITEYILRVNNDVIYVEIDALCDGNECKINGTGTKKLEVGKNESIIRVTAQDKTTKEYKVIINRAEEETVDNNQNIIIYIVIGIGLLASIIIVVFIIVKSNKKRKQQIENSTLDNNSDNNIND